MTNVYFTGLALTLLHNLDNRCSRTEVAMQPILLANEISPPYILLAFTNLGNRC